MSQYEKRGYLNGEFKLFYLSDIPTQEFEFHYHDFDKIIIFLKGNVNYIIEGKSYSLLPYDLVLVNHNDIHRPQIDPTVPYERIIVYLSPRFMTSYQTIDYDLMDCFHRAKNARSDVLRIRALEKSSLFQTIQQLEQAGHSKEYANELYCQVLFLEFMIQLNRASLTHHLDFIQTEHCNQKVLQLMEYINLHLTADLSVEQLAQTFYLSKYHMMRLFKQETGYTLGSYISSKRLLMAKRLLIREIPLTQVCFDCGFKNYSTFSRAYKDFFGESPTTTRSQTLLQF
ncbi:MAG: AraC family transcriptional regulator [Hungatella sp.]